MSHDYNEKLEAVRAKLPTEFTVVDVQRICGVGYHQAMSLIDNYFNNGLINAIGYGKYNFAKGDGDEQA